MVIDQSREFLASRQFSDLDYVIFSPPYRHLISIAGRREEHWTLCRTSKEVDPLFRSLFPLENRDVNPVLMGQVYPHQAGVSRFNYLNKRSGGKT